MALYFFLAFVAGTVGITYWASKRTKTAAEFFAAGSSLTGFQNGWAVAGDYMSAASFLGISGLIATGGYDGFMYSVGWLVAYLTVLFVVAEPLRNVGRYTMADLLAYRLKNGPVRSVAALSTLSVSIFYLLAQMVGAGAIIQLFFPYLTPSMSIVIIGIIMIGYVVFGGMLATTWVQIVKAVLLMAGTFLISLLVWNHFNWSLSDLLQAAATRAAAEIPGKIASPDAFLNPGILYKNPLDLISLGIALVLGTAGLPHILVRFYTVPNAKQARVSVVWAMILIGTFYILTTFLGFGSAALVGPNAIMATKGGSNMAAPMLAESIGTTVFGTVGGNLLFAFVGAVAFATILAVVGGLTVASSGAFAHDFYTNVLKKGRVAEGEAVKVARIASFVIGGVAIILALMVQKANVAYLVALAFAVAASGNLPAIVLSVFWKRFNTVGAVSALLAGLVSSVGLVLIGPAVMGKNAIFPLSNPAIVSVPIGFIAAYLGTVLTTEPEAEHKFAELTVRAHTGEGAE